MSALLFRTAQLTYRCVDTSSNSAKPLRRFDVYGRDTRGEDLLARVHEDRNGVFSGDVVPGTRFERPKMLLEQICNILSHELHRHQSTRGGSTVESWSDFVREPTRVLPLLERGVDVILHRRDGEAVVLSMQSHAERSNLGTELAALVVSGALSTSPNVLKTASENALASRFPWVRLLPADARDAFLCEFLAMLEACASVGNMTRLAELVSDWKATAEVYADPVLASELTKPIENPTSVLVPRPDAKGDASPRQARRAKAG
jgi:hypothetical protein